MPSTFTSKEYALAREVVSTLTAVPALAPYVLPEVLNFQSQADRLLADAQANSVCVAVAVGEPQAEQQPAPRFTPAAGWVNATLYVWVFARNEYAVTTAAAAAHETCCAVQDAVLHALAPVYMNPQDTERRLPAALTAVDEVDLTAESDLQHMAARRLTLLFPIFYK